MGKYLEVRALALQVPALNHISQVGARAANGTTCAGVRVEVNTGRTKGAVEVSTKLDGHGVGRTPAAAFSAMISKWVSLQVPQTA